MAAEIRSGAARAWCERMAGRVRASSGRTGARAFGKGLARQRHNRFGRLAGELETAKFLLRNRRSRGHGQASRPHSFEGRGTVAAATASAIAQVSLSAGAAGNGERALGGGGAKGNRVALPLCPASPGEGQAIAPAPLLI